MKYLCLAYGDKSKMDRLSKEQFHALLERIRPMDAELRASGHYVSGNSLDWGGMCIRPRGGKSVVTDGPYIESKEQVGGLVMIEAADLNEAVRIASLHPAARFGEELGWGIEIRPLGECGPK